MKIPYYMITVVNNDGDPITTQEHDSFKDFELIENAFDDDMEKIIYFSNSLSEINNFFQYINYFKDEGTGYLPDDNFSYNIYITGEDNAIISINYDEVIELLENYDPPGVFQFN